MQIRRSQRLAILCAAVCFALFSFYSIYIIATMSSASTVVSTAEPMQIPWNELSTPSEQLAPSQLNRHFPPRARLVSRHSVTQISGTVPVAIFKLPRTGSSWFTEVLNRIPSVYISKEIMQASDQGKYSNKQIEDHLIRALTRPTDKIVHMNDWMPGGRFKTDYVDTRKFLNTLDIVGFTMNPQHANDAKYIRLAKEVPGLKLIVLTRSNHVKTALSGVRGRMLHQTCGISNLKEGVKCTIPSTLQWRLRKFISDMNNLERRTRTFMDVVYSIGVPVYEVTYEDLQRNEQETIAKVLAWLGKPQLAKKETSDFGDGWVKRTSDDISKVVENYDVIEKYLKETEDDPGRCYLDQLKAQAPQNFPPCHIVLNNLSDSEIIRRETLSELRIE